MTDALRAGLGAALAPRTAVVVGRTDEGAGFDLWSNLNLTAETVAVHRAGRAAPGARVVAQLADVPFAPDLCALAIGAGAIVAGARDAVERGCRMLVVPGLGPEDGEAGARARAELADLCEASGAALLGPNCMGIAVPGSASAWIGSVPLADLRAGGVSCVVHSGSLGEALLHAGPRFGLRAVISSGNEIARDAADWLAALVDDHDTTVIGLALETIRRPASFAAALARAARAGKPVIVLASGRSQAGSRAALAHSGAVVGSARGVAALCAAHGAISVPDVPDWLEHLEAFSAGRRLRGPRLVALTNSGGEGGLVADAAESAGLELIELPDDLARSLAHAFPGLPAGNPVDYWAVGPAEELAPALARACGAHAGVDGLVLVAEQSLHYGPDEQAVARAGVDAAIAAAHDGAFAAVVACATADADPAALRAAGAAGVPVLKGAGPALRALAALSRWSPHVRRPIEVGRAPELPELAAGDVHLSEHASRAVLARYGVRGPRERVAATSAEAADAARELGAPVVVKRHGPAHKERSGGVVLGCLTPADAATAAERVGLPVLVCEDLRGGVELLCGMLRDPQVGPLVVLGVGGSLAEALAGSSGAALAPLDDEEAHALVRAGPLGAALVERDRAAVAAVLVSLGRLAAHRPDVTAIDINPLRVRDGDAVALDALIVLDDIVKESQWISGLTPAQLELQQRAATFVDEELIPLEVEAELAFGRLDAPRIAQVRARARALGLVGGNHPPELGGQGWSALEAVLVHEELGRSTNAIWWAVEGGYNVLGLGTPAQIDRYLRPILRGERQDAYAVTEAEAGSDPSQLATTAERVPGGFRLRGEKWFVTSGDVADVYIVMANAIGHGPTLFLVDADTPGIETVDDPPFTHNYPHGHPTLRFDCVLPEESVLGGAEMLGRGNEGQNAWFVEERLHIAARCVGAMRRLLVETVAWAGARRQFGERIIDFQGVSFPLADSATECTSARLLTYLAAQSEDDHADPKLVHARASMAKLYASEAAWRCADRCVQTFGGRGYMRTNVAERFLRELRVDRIWEGTSEVQRLIVARALERRGVERVLGTDTRDAG